MLAARFNPVYRVFLNKYGFDELYQKVFADGSRWLGEQLWQWGDRTVIDGWLVNGSAALVNKSSLLVRRLQSGLVYHYAFAMIIGLVGLMSWLFFA